MTPALDARTLLRESVPLAVVVSVFTALSWLAGGPALGTALRYAGVALAFGYVLVQSRALAETIDATALPRSPGAVAASTLTPILGAGAWFLAARLLPVLGTGWDALGLPGAFVNPTPALQFGTAATGFLTVVLYTAVFARTRLTEGEDGPEWATTGDATPSDD
jgi:hypothetical protein